MRIASGTRVRMRGTEQIGTASVDFDNCCADWETPVVWDGVTYFEGVKTDLLEATGSQNAVVDDGCGLGQEEKCCIFVVGDKRGQHCGRHNPNDHWDCIMGGTRVAKREPSEPYPNCKISPLPAAAQSAEGTRKKCKK